MRSLTDIETAVVSGALTQLITSHHLFQITVTGQGKFVLGCPWNGYSFNMVFYSDHVSDLNGNEIFRGTTGNFAYDGFKFNISSTNDGVIYLLTDPIIN